MNLKAQLKETALKFAERAAVSSRNGALSYKELFEKAISFAETLNNVEAGEGILIYGEKAENTMVAILGTLLSGRFYIPLNPAFPLERNLSIAEQSGASDIYFPGPSIPNLTEMLGDTVNVISLEETTDKTWPDCLEAINWDESSDRPAYLLFTSGSTGLPKGIQVYNSNLSAYLSNILKELDLKPTDRFSQLFDLTFDLSAHDLFVCWSVGACLCLPSAGDLLMPDSYINRERLTVWFSVPSLADYLDMYKRLKPGAFSSLRYGIFCGEPLKTITAKRFSEACPNGALVNLYGPTEATIAFTIRHVTQSDLAAEKPFIPIGRPFRGQVVKVANNTDASTGELLLQGSQVTQGYLNDPVRTKKSFIELEGERWYRTGDIVEINKEGELDYKERSDRQIKIRGYRVETAEVENQILKIIGHGQVACVPKINVAGFIESLYAFIASPQLDKNAILKRCAEVLPDYMVPSGITHLDTLPRNANGKVDYRSLELSINEPTVVSA